MTTGALRGARVVNTRALHQAAELDALLLEQGAIPLSYPCLAIAPPEETHQLDSVVRALSEGQFDWLVLTSANAVTVIAERMIAIDIGRTHHPEFKVATVGEATAAAVTAQLGLPVSFVSIDRRGKALARELPIANGNRVLMPVSEIASPEPAAILRARGADVSNIVAYRTIMGTGGIDLPDHLQRGAVDAITFTSPSAITGCLTRLAAEGGSIEALANITIVTIGPTTDQAAKSHGLRETVMSPSPSPRDLVETLDATLSRTRLEGGEAWLSRSTV